MTRRRIYWATGLFLAAVVVAVFLSSGDGLPPPRYVAGAPKSPGPSRMDDYRIADGAPIEGDRLWLLALTPTTNAHTFHFHDYLYDLAHRTIMGELIGGSPVLYDQRDSRVLVMVRSQPVQTAGDKMKGVLSRISGRGPGPWSGNWLETYSVLDLRNNASSKLWDFTRLAGASSSWTSSPDGRYGCTTAEVGEAILLCDLANGTLIEIGESGSPVGWWTDHEILLVSDTNEFDLYDVVARKRRQLFSPAYVKTFLEKEHLADAGTNLWAFPNWNGRGYDFYFGPVDSWEGLQQSDSFLLEADQANSALKLVYRNFRFQLGAHLDSTGTHYLYPGESGTPGSGGDGAVYLKNLTNGTTLTLAPPDNKGLYSKPLFYGNEVIYSRNHLLWRVGINGSNDTLLLPAPRQ